eukprot:4815579-Alexandrium_andersonii.AAC.1
MHLHPRMAWLLQLFPEVRTFTYMGCYGAETLKPTVLRSNKHWTRELARRPTAEEKERCSKKAVVFRSASGG